MGICCVRFPGGVHVSEDASDVLLRYLGDVFFGVTERCNCEGSEDVQTWFCFCVYVLCVLSERHSSVVGYSKCGGVVGVWDQLTVQLNGRLSHFFQTCQHYQTYLMTHFVERIFLRLTTSDKTKKNPLTKLRKLPTKCSNGIKEKNTV